MRLHWLIGGTLAALVGLAVLWYGWDEFATKGFAPKQKTQNWQNWRRFAPFGISIDSLETTDPTVPDEAKPGILLRREQSNGGNLLLKHSIVNDVYQYDLQTKQISVATSNQWNNAQGEIKICRKRFDSGNATFKLALPNLIASRTVRDQVIKAYALHLEGTLESPSHQKLGVLSAYGPLLPATGGMPGLGGSEAKVYGQRYLQIAKSSDKLSISKPIRLQIDDAANQNIGLCWSRDEELLVLFSTTYEYFFVVEAEF